MYIYVTYIQIHTFANLLLNTAQTYIHTHTFTVLRGCPSQYSADSHNCLDTYIHTYTHTHTQFCADVPLSIVQILITPFHTYTHTHTHTVLRGCPSQHSADSHNCLSSILFRWFSDTSILCLSRSWISCYQYVSGIYASVYVCMYFYLHRCWISQLDFLLSICFRYLCVCVCMYVFIFACMCVRPHIYSRMFCCYQYVSCSHACTYVCVRSVRVCAYTFIHVYTRLYI